MTQVDPTGLNPNSLLRNHFFRLRNQKQRIDRLPDGDRKRADLSRWESAVAVAQEQFALRVGVKYQLEYPSELPIANYRNQIVDILSNRQVMVLCGETGSGKSTQLPKLCLEAGFGRQGWIGHTQPRRLAARSVAQRLAEELDTSLGDVVGYKVRFNDRTRPTSLIKLMTDGVLLAEIQRDRYLTSYDCVIVDEAHERSLNIDILMAYLHRLLPKRPEFRVIITSATIDAERFSEHFQDAIGSAPIVMVEGRGYPVEVRYRGAMASREMDPNFVAAEYADSMVQRFCDAVDELLMEPRGDILAFFPTERDIRDASKQLRGHLTRRGLLNSIEVLPLYARLTETEQQRIFAPHSMQRIVLATNVAESSLTVPGIRYVIDTGTSRISRFAAKSRVQRLPIEPISQASANQRSGRCGRLGPGIAIRLFDEADYLARAPFASPEIRRSNLASTIVHIKSLGIENMDDLAWLDPPRPESIREGISVLRELQAIDENERLTAIGKQLSRWPVEPRIGRVLIEANQNGCLNDALIIAAAFETQDPRVRPPEQQSAADEAHQKFRDPNSDFLSYLKIWDHYHALREKLGRSRLEKACRESFLSMPRMREWADVHRQLLEQCHEMGLHVGPRKLALPVEPPQNKSGKPDSFDKNSKHGKPNVPIDRSFPPGYDALHVSLLTGFLSGIAMLEDTGKHKGASNLEVAIWPGSNLKSSRAKWIMAGELVETTQRFARSNAVIDIAWIEKHAQHLIKYSYDEPHFSRKNGCAMVMQRGTLFGLPVVPRKSVPLAPLDPALARKLLIEVGLAEHELVSRARFWQHNCEFLEEVKSLGDKTRRRDLVIDTYQLMEFYRKRIPETVVDRVTLEKWDRGLPRPSNKPSADRPPAQRNVHASAATTSSALSPYMSWEDLNSDLDHDEIEEQFPAELNVGVSQLPLRYRYEPGANDDGVSIVVPQSVVFQLNSEKLEWLVPGLLDEKLACLIKSLPKRLRRQLVPVPDTVRELLPGLTSFASSNAPFWKTLCDLLTKRLGETVRISDFDMESIPQHLRMRVEVIDEKGKMVQSSRDLNELQKASVPNFVAVPDGGSQKPAAYPWTRASMETWDIEQLPLSVAEVRGGVRMSLFPTLSLREGKIGTSLVTDERLAEQLLRIGLVQLYGRIEKREIRSQIQFLPQLNACGLWLSGRYSADSLRAVLHDLIARLAFIDGDYTKGIPTEPTKCMRSLVEFEISRLKRIEKIAGAAAEIGRWLPKMAEAYHRLRSILEKTPSQWDLNRKSIQSQLDTLFSEPIATSTPWFYVREYPRYLQAMVARLERIKTIGPSKDMAMEQSVMTFWNDYQQRASEFQRSSIQNNNEDVRLEPRGTLLEYRWMIEEFRVSLFAQQLGTKISVSPKRLEKARDSL